VTTTISGKKLVFLLLSRDSPSCGYKNFGSKTGRTFPSFVPSSQRNDCDEQDLCSFSVFPKQDVCFEESRRILVKRKNI
jgi:hypothetical protein